MSSSLVKIVAIVIGPVTRLLGKAVDKNKGTEKGRPKEDAQAEDQPRQ